MDCREQDKNGSSPMGHKNARALPVVAKRAYTVAIAKDPLELCEVKFDPALMKSEKESDSAW